MSLTPTLCIVGSSNMDLVARVPRLPAPGETLTGLSFSTGYGGKGANQAVMAARLGARVSMVTRLGRDGFGAEMLQNYRAQGIDTAFVTVDDTVSSGVALITVNDVTGQNSIVIVPGANGRLSAADSQAARDVIQAADVLIGQLEVPIAATLEAFRLAKANGTPGLTRTILNPAPAAPLPDALLAVTDILTPNETETALLTGQPVDTLDAVEAAARMLQARGPQTVIVTLGARGVLFIEGAAAAQNVPAQVVQAVDSTGAGDAFVGSLAYFLGAGRPLRDAIERASAVATRSVLKMGAQSSFPTRDEIPELLTW